MLRNKKTKIAALVLTALMLILLFVPFDPQTVGLNAKSPLPMWGGMGWGRLSYSFFHANLLHWLLNSWCFLSCVFIGDASARKCLAAYVVACTAPALGAVPTIGFSGVCFALLGMSMWRSPRKLRYNIIMCATIGLTWLLCPHTVNNALHAYCYTAGIAVEAIDRFVWNSKKGGYCDE